VFSGSVLIAQRNDVLFEYVCGEANKPYRAPANIETKFNFGSANKMFTAVAIAQLDNAPIAAGAIAVAACPAVAAAQ
jgi:CubicO group peptidase (beta-lactamase class C family)